MPTAAFPSVIRAVYSIAKAGLDPTHVVRSRDISGGSGDVVMIGRQSVDDDTAGTFQQTMQTFGGNREEVGTVYGLVLAWNGDNDPDAALDVAFGYLAVLETAFRADKMLGLTTFDYVVAEMRSGDVLESPNDAGVTVTLPFAIDYKIRI